MPVTAFFSPDDVIHSYSRAQALADGALVDASAMAKEAGIKVPVALTRAAWGAAVRWEGSALQDEKGRLWDVLWLLRNAARLGGSTIRFTVFVVPIGKLRPQPVVLKAVCGPGDNAEPVITILLPDED